MSEISIEVGRIVCHLASSLGGLGHARCYDSSVQEALGSGFLFALVALAVGAGTLSRSVARSG